MYLQYYSYINSINKFGFVTRNINLIRDIDTKSSIGHTCKIIINILLKLAQASDY